MVNSRQNIYHLFFICVFTILFMPLFLNTPTASAHSSLVEAVPAEQVVTEKTPPMLKLRFNEPVDSELARAVIYDWNAKPVFTGKPDGGLKTASLLEFTLPKLKHGTYTVQWNVISLDGHPVSGSYIFAVGTATENGTKPVIEKGKTIFWLLILVRAITEGMLLICAGLYVFSKIMHRHNLPDLHQLIGKSSKMVISILFAGTILEWVCYAFLLPGGILQTIITGRWDLFVHFPFMIMLSVQLLCLILLILPGMVKGWYIAMWIILASVPAFGGHVWGLEHPYIALIPRVVHELSIALWLGALLYLLLLWIRQKRHHEKLNWQQLHSPFTKCLLPAAILVIISGVMMAYMQTGLTAIYTNWMNWSTLLIIKLVLTICMLGFALFQTWKWQRNKTFKTPKLIRLEWLAGIIVLFIGVWMSQIAYPIPVKTYENILQNSDAKAGVQIPALQTGKQKMQLNLPQLEDNRPNQVNVMLSMPDHDMDAGLYEAKEITAGVYQAELPFSMPGVWEFVVQAVYPDGTKSEWQDQVFIPSIGTNN